MTDREALRFFKKYSKARKDKDGCIIYNSEEMDQALACAIHALKVVIEANSMDKETR